MGPSPTFSFFVLFDGVDALRHNLTVSLIFDHFLFNYHKVNVLRHILNRPPFFYFFVLTSKLNSLRHILGPSPTFYSFFSVLMWLMISDIIWPPPFFFIILYQIITRSMFSDIFWPSPLFFIFCLEFKIEFSPTYFGAFSYFLRLMIWNFSSFLSFFIQLSQGQSSPTYFDSSAYFFNFYCVVTKLVFNHFCQNIEHEFETWYQQQWLKWLGRHCFNAMIEWIVESLPRKWILLEYKLIWFMFH